MSAQHIISSEQKHRMNIIYCLCWSGPQREYYCPSHTNNWNHSFLVFQFFSRKFYVKHTWFFSSAPIILGYTILFCFCSQFFFILKTCSLIQIKATYFIVYLSVAMLMMLWACVLLYLILIEKLTVGRVKAVASRGGRTNHTGWHKHKDF